MKKYKWLLIVAAIWCLAIVPLAGCGVSQADYDALQAENEDLTAELAAAQSDLTSLQADYDALNADYEAASAELADLNAVYPPKEFASRTALEDWLLANDVSEKPVTATYAAWYGRALEVQGDALADGYVISVDYDYDAQTDSYFVYCVAIINGDIYYWDPETDDVYYEPGLTNVE
jgi:outer membrane murein-binding lipoprotein Lpp